MERVFDSGLSSSIGIGMGKVYVIHPYQKITLEKVSLEKISGEKERLIHARKKVIIQIQELIEKTEAMKAHEQTELFEAHLTLFEDEDFENDILEKIEKNHYSAEYATEEFIEETTQDLLQLDEYFRERVSDIQDLGRRLIAVLQNKVYNDYKDIGESTIIFAQDLTPSMTTQLDVSKIVGFVTEQGGVTSHVSFIAQNLGIPAIVGAKEVLSHVKNGYPAIIDAIDIRVIINPEEDTKAHYRVRKQEYQDTVKKLLENTTLPAITLDGVIINLVANIGGEQDLASVDKYGAEGIGLFRTEFLFMEGAPPSEEKQFGIYKNVITHMQGKRVVIRTLDIGGDKHIPYLSLPQEQNPFLGYRALRIYADHNKIIGQQIRAILRASAYGEVYIMIPMVISVAEVTWVKEFIKNIEKELVSEGQKVGKYHIGIMVETPSVAIMSDVFIQEVDFFSIGTNDLVQYTLAVDRGNEKVADLYQPFHPAITRLIGQVIRSAKEQKKSVSVCGDMGGDEYGALLLLGLGLTTISMSPSKIPIIKNIIRRVNLKKLQANLHHTLLSATTLSETRSVVQDMMKIVMSEQ